MTPRVKMTHDLAISSCSADQVRLQADGKLTFLKTEITGCNSTCNAFITVEAGAVYNGISCSNATETINGHNI
ncbi:hypothetical protein PRIPAC_70029 [Pristionchus pacificus]|uniref:Uncharacterized protein n=1 Tax=Pristionchus pacificus TaxID=54126 RepID=A0A2A6BZV0_PRIPA|nr:hypothetical protein PRIPAC_70029 [Pristionchus pacificus]|eukprot:PDM71464.1 hypothetical protein PRIPAC_37871 [Pristionchus pacificus]